MNLLLRIFCYGSHGVLHLFVVVVVVVRLRVCFKPSVFECIFPTFDILVFKSFKFTISAYIRTYENYP